MQNERQTFNLTFFLIFQLVSFIDAQPEFVMRRSATANFHFANAKKRFIIILVFRKKALEPFFCIGRDGDFQHMFS